MGIRFEQIQNVPTNRVIARSTAGNGPVEDLTLPQFRTLINVEDGATANSSDSTLLDRANHTGTQLAATISDFDTEVSNNTDVAANTTARHDAVTLAGTPNYITIAGQVITRALINLTSHVTGTLPIANGGTNATDAATARTNLGAAPTASPTFTGTTTVDRINYDQGVGTVSALGNLGTTETINWATATHFSGNLDANITFTFSNNTSGQSITLYLSYSGAQRTITWPTITWLDNATGAAPTAPATTGNVLVVTLQDIGGTIYGSATGNYAVYA